MNISEIRNPKSEIPADSPVIDKSELRIRRMFGEISPRYDFLNHFLSGGTDRYWRWRTVRAAPPCGDAPILDVCTGTGDLALAYWRKSRGRVPVFGTDFTPQMLDIAREKFGRIRQSVTNRPPHPNPLPRSGGEGTKLEGLADGLT